MARRLAAVTFWLAIGHATMFGLFWLLLNVPESNIVMLIASALVILLIVVDAAIVEGAAVMWLDAYPARRSLATRIPSAFLSTSAAALAFWLIWWITGRTSRWLSAHGGEMDAWLLLHFNITKTARLHSTLDWIVTIVRYPVGLSLAASLVAAGTLDGVRALGRALARAFSPLRLLLVSLIWAALLLLPWSVVYWRPRTIEVGLEPAFVAVKLALVYVVMNVGVAAILAAALPTIARRVEPAP